MEKSVPGTRLPHLLLISILCTQIAAAQESQAPPMAGDLDSFMEQVLKRRQVNWEQLHNYVFSEREVLEIKGVRIASLANFTREYTWFVRDGYLVRSPTRVDGVKVSKKDQEAAENEWFEKRKRHREHLRRESFFGFKFEPGSYLFAGRKKFEGRDVVAVEYYPNKHQQRIDGDPEEDIERMFEKTVLVTMLVAPEEHQIVQITFDNVGLEFLPVRWLVRLQEIRATLIMDKPLGDVWLPRRISAAGSVDTAGMSLSVKYFREFYDYAKTDVKVKFRFESSGEAKP